MSSVEMIVVFLLTNVVAFIVGARAWARGRASVLPPKREARCTGYSAKYSDGTLTGVFHDDCSANRSEDCRDGRCRYHCTELCGCERAPLVSFDARLAASQKTGPAPRTKN